MRTPLTTALSMVVFLDAVMWLGGLIPTLYYAFSHDRLPTIGSIRLLGGPFEKLGMNALIVAGIGFTMVSAMKILAGYWLWNSRMDGAVFELVLLGLSSIFWYGFELPLGPLFGIIQAVLLVFAWGSLH